MLCPSRRLLLLRLCRRQSDISVKFSTADEKIKYKKQTTKNPNSLVPFGGGTELHIITNGFVRRRRHRAAYAAACSFRHVFVCVCAMRQHRIQCRQTLPASDVRATPDCDKRTNAVRPPVCERTREMIVLMLLFLAERRQISSP